MSHLTPHKLKTYRIQKVFRNSSILGTTFLAHSFLMGHTIIRIQVKVKVQLRFSVPSAWIAEIAKR